MKIKRILCLLLTVVLLLTTGCTAKNKKSGFELYKPDTVMMTINGEPVYWQEFFYFLNYYYTDDMNVYSGITQWDEENKEAILADVRNEISFYRALTLNAADLGITLTDDDKTQLDSFFAAEIENAGSEEAYTEYLASTYASKELLSYWFTAFYYYRDGLLKHFFGENGKDISNDEARLFAEDYGLVQAKHILVKTMDSENNSLEGDALAEKTALAESLLNRINQYDGEDLQGFFDGLMKEYSEDEGLEAYPDGYLFGQGTMVEEFYSAAMELGDYQVSGLVESVYGYHIIMRIPVNPDMSVVSTDGSKNSLRQWAAYAGMEDIEGQWISGLEIEYTSKYKSLDLNKIFPAE